MTRTTDEVIDRFSRAFRERDAILLEDIIAPDCVMESVQPAPDGTRYEGYDASFSSSTRKLGKTCDDHVRDQFDHDFGDRPPAHRLDNSR